MQQTTLQGRRGAAVPTITVSLYHTARDLALIPTKAQRPVREMALTVNFSFNVSCYRAGKIIVLIL